MAAKRNGRGRPQAASAEREVDALYGLAPDEFVAARDELAKRVRREGDRERADAIKALRKPSVAAWAANQLARRHRDELDALLAAGDALRAAQRDVLAGKGDASALARASADERAAAARLVERAAAALRDAGAGATEATLQRIRDTLHAAATDADARAELAAGRLTRERAAAGLGTDLLAGLADGGGSGPPAAPGKGGRGRAKRTGAADRAASPGTGAAASPDTSAADRAGGAGKESARSRPRRSDRSRTGERTRPPPRPGSDGGARRAAERKRLLAERAEARGMLQAAERALREARREVAAAERRAGRAEAEARRAREALEQVEARIGVSRARQAER